MSSPIIPKMLTPEEWYSQDNPPTSQPQLSGANQQTSQQTNQLAGNSYAQAGVGAEAVIYDSDIMLSDILAQRRASLETAVLDKFLEAQRMAMSRNNVLGQPSQPISYNLPEALHNLSEKHLMDCAAGSHKALQHLYDEAMKMGGMGPSHLPAPPMPPSGSTPIAQAGSIMTTHPEIRLLDMLAARFRMTASQMARKFKKMDAITIKGNLVHIYLVTADGDAVHIDDDASLFPSDQLVTQLRMLLS